MIAMEHQRGLEENASLKAQIAELESQPSQLKLQLQRKEDFASDIQKFNDLITNLKAHEAKMQAKFEQCVTERDQRRAEMQKLSQEKTRLEVCLVIGRKMMMMMMMMMMITNDNNNSSDDE